MNKHGIIRFCILILTLVAAGGIVSQVSAAPAAPIDLQVSQPDGTSFTARQWGDEWQNGMETAAGYTILEGEDGWWSYAVLEDGGALGPARQAGGERLLVGIDSPEGLPLHIRPEKAGSLDSIRLSSGLQSQNIGTQKVLVLLASFSDQNGFYTADNFASSIFGAANSVKDFYLDASFNQLTLSAAAETHGTENDGVIGWLNLGYAHPNTGSTTNNANQLIVKNALNMADPYINYATYDTNGDGYIALTELHIVVVVAGYERSFTNLYTPSIWAHRWDLFNVGTTTLDGKVLGHWQYGGYAQFGERHGDHQATIGIMAHELGHDLTWPDLYDTDYSSEGVGDWSIMGGGSWNDNAGLAGSSPALPDAWLKWYQGWITPTPVVGILNGASIGQSATNPSAYLLGTNPNGVDWDFTKHSGSGEYFLVENRNNVGYDVGLPGCGLLITHIDEAVTNTNDANANENRPLVKVIEADGWNDLYLANNRGDTGDPFPGLSNNQVFGYNTTPNSRLYSGADSLVEVNTISGCGTTMTATLRYGSPTVYDNFVYLPLIKNGNAVTPTNPILNGTFEAGQDGSWVESSTNGWDLIVQTFADPVTPHAGTWAVWLAGDDNETSTLTQSNISMSGVRYLHYWYYIASNDYCGYDYAYVKVNGTPLHTYDLCDTTNTNGWAHRVLDLNSYSGTTISLVFQATTDSGFTSNFYLDDVSLSSSAAAPELTETHSSPASASQPKGSR